MTSESGTGMRLCWGCPKQDLVTCGFELTEVSLLNSIAVKRASFQSVFLHFGENLFYPISSEEEARMAAAMVFLYNTKDFDSDGWIAEAQKLEEETQCFLESDDSVENSEEEDVYNFNWDEY